MLQVDTLTKKFGMFLLVYMALLLLSAWQPIRDGHNAYYSRIGRTFFNAVNINFHSEWLPTAPSNTSGWDTTIKLYSLERHGNKVSSKAYIRQTQPSQIAYNNFYGIAFLPLLFLIALYLVTTDMIWYEKLWRFGISWIILNIFIAFHISHIIENVMRNNGEVGDTLWHKTIALFGFYGLSEGLYIIAALSWGVMVLHKVKLN